MGQLIHLCGERSHSFVMDTVYCEVPVSGCGTEKETLQAH
jgi:hypothetical protein